MRFILIILFWIGLAISSAHAESFVVDSIQIKGLKGLSQARVRHYLAVRPGQLFNTNETDLIINKLYGTGFFDNVKVERKGNSLILRLSEKPLIAHLTVSGAKEMITRHPGTGQEGFDSFLKSIGLISGQVFNPEALSTLKKAIQAYYDKVGKYSARVDTKVIPVSSNQVDVRVDVSEGLTTEIAGIRILGARAFPEYKLIAALPISIYQPLLFFLGGQYQSDTLQNALEVLRNYYFDRGYPLFTINSAQAALTPDRKQVHIVMRVTEGPCYKNKGYRLIGNTALSNKKLQSLVKIIPNTYFSKKAVVETEQSIKRALGNLGYIHANVYTLPSLDERLKTVFFNLYIDPLNKIYVRRINIKGNIKTRDEAIRRVMPLKEASLASLDKIEQSVRAIQMARLGHPLLQPQITEDSVPGRPDWVDLNVLFTESTLFQAKLNVGYSKQTNFLGEIALKQDNFLGTGNALLVSLMASPLRKSFGFRYFDPFYTLDGVSQSFGASYYSTKLDTVSSWEINGLSANLGYSIPVSKDDELSFNTNLRKIDLLLADKVSSEVDNFTKPYGKDFWQVVFTPGWNHNTLDRLLFPQKGTEQSFQVAFYALLNNKLTSPYYKATYDATVYWPVIKDFTLSGNIVLGYGNCFRSGKLFPFFDNYSYNLRGYEQVGPTDSLGKMLGGNIAARASLNLILPPPFSRDYVRSKIFIDAGNVYSTLGASEPDKPRGGTDPGPIRLSAGIAFDIYIPVVGFMLKVGFGYPLNKQPEDQVSILSVDVGLF